MFCHEWTNTADITHKELPTTNYQLHTTPLRVSFERNDCARLPSGRLMANDTAHCGTTDSSNGTASGQNSTRNCTDTRAHCGVLLSRRHTCATAQAEQGCQAQATGDQSKFPLHRITSLKSNVETLQWNDRTRHQASSEVTFQVTAVKFTALMPENPAGRWLPLQYPALAKGLHERNRWLRRPCASPC